MKTIALLLFGVLCSSGYAQSNLIEAEYFIDLDPGVGNGVDIPITSGQQIEESFIADLGDLLPGMHSIKIRVKDENDVWSHFSSENFFVRNPVDLEIVDAEYVLDEDPGVGNGIVVNVASGLEVDGDFVVDIDALDPGMHCIKVRTKNAGGIWGLYSAELFIAHNLSSPNTIEAVEFFIDQDPGVGNGEPLSFTPGTELDETLLIPIPMGVSEGFHFMYIRVKHLGENWSLYAREEFEVDNTVGIENQSIEIAVYPNPVVDLITVLAPSGSINAVLVFDNQGQKVYANGALNGPIDCSDWAAGEYIVRVVAEAETYSYKVIKLP